MAQVIYNRGINKLTNEKGNEMKELEIAISQLKKAMANVDKAEEKMFRQHHQANADVAEKISIQIAGLSDELAILNKSYKG